MIVGQEIAAPSLTTSRVSTLNNGAHDLTRVVEPEPEEEKSESDSDTEEVCAQTRLWLIVLGS